MKVKFTDEDHKYITVVDPNDEFAIDIQWTSVTTLIGKFKNEFKEKEVALNCSKKKPTASKPNKWYGMSIEDILQAWEDERNRSTRIGSLYHNHREFEVRNQEFLVRQGKNVKVYSPDEKDGVKYSSDQKLKEGIYPEHLVYMKSAGVVGQADRFEVIGNVLDIYDYKTSKVIEKESFVDWQGKSKKFHSPISHLDECNFYEYALQLSIYMYMALRHNRHLVPGKLTVEHIIFELEGEDKFGYPIIKMEKGLPVVKEIIEYNLPYLKDEVVNIIKYKRNNPNKFI